MKNTVITGYAIDTPMHTHLYEAHERPTVYAKARQLAKLYRKTVKVTVMREEKPKPLEPSLEDAPATASVLRVLEECQQYLYDAMQDALEGQPLAVTPEGLEALEGPPEEALEGSGPSVPEVYEVIVPVRVIVRVGRYNMTSERPVVSNEWLGFFTEAEENSGVWDVEEEQWGSDHSDTVTISEVARRSVQNHLDVAYFK